MSTGTGAAVCPPQRLSVSPSHSSGSVRLSGSSWWSMSMKVRAIRNQVSTSAARPAKPKPNFHATAAESSPVSSSTSG